VRSAIAGSLIAAGLCVVSAQQAPPRPFRVTLLGTGNPNPRMDRFGPSILVEAGGTRFLFDAGRGAIQRLRQLNRGDCDALFLTHLHSDHVVGVSDLWLTGWLTERRDRPLRVWGPPGTAAMMDHLRQAFSFDVAFRISDDRRPPAGAQLDVREIAEGAAWEADGVKVTAFDVDHRPVTPAFGYRIDYAGHAVILSGDTRLSEHLISMATGADLVVHEVVARQDPAATQATDRVLAHHTMPDQAGEVFTRVRPKLAVYTHIGGDVSDEDLVRRTRRTYSGALVVGKDLMAFDISDRVTVIDDATKAGVDAASPKKK
jgi:ribonuclease Z